MPNIRPDFRIVAEGQDITALIRPHFHVITIQDRIGGSADNFNMKLGYSNAYAIPTTGATLEVEIGYHDSGRWALGSFVVDKVVVTGSGSAVGTIDVTAQNMPQSPTDARRSLRTSHNRYWSQKTFGDIVTNVCAGAGIEPKFEGGVERIEMPMTVQSMETDAEFLYRISLFRDILVKYNDFDVVFARRHEGVIGQFEVRPNMVMAWSFDVRDRTNYDSLEVTYQDKDTGENQTLIYGSGENRKIIRRLYTSKETAQEAAVSYLKELQRNVSKCSFTMPSMPDLIAEKVINMRDFPQHADSEFVLESVTHNLTSASLTTTCQGKQRT